MKFSKEDILLFAKDSCNKYYYYNVPTLFYYLPKVHVKSITTTIPQPIHLLSPKLFSNHSQNQKTNLIHIFLCNICRSVCLFVCLLFPVKGPKGLETGPKAPKLQPEALTQTEIMLAEGQHELS